MKRIFSVGIELPGKSAEHVPFRSDKSLFDSDITIFRPTFEDYFSISIYQGENRIAESDSADLVRDCEHWKGELKAAADSGKVVFVLLSKPDLCYYDTGQRSYSGTGRNQRTTTILAPKSSYDSIPLSLAGLTPRGGTEITRLPQLGPLAAYWTEFEGHSAYEVYFDAKAGIIPILATKGREKVVGCIARSNGGGALVLLPPLRWDETSFTYTRGEGTYWNKEAVVFGKRLVSALVEAAEAVRRSDVRSPEPEWASAQEYETPLERVLRAELAQIDSQMISIAKARTAKQAELDEASVLRWLLYETGKPLEIAILKALRLIGFSAEPFKDGESEFDAVFVAPERQCLGEAEGKDNKAINVDKISQLARNLEEDFAREGVTEYAKGVLFGNAFRIQPIAERGDFFTDKCKTTAERMKAALVRTPDLFAAAQYLVGNADAEYARLCREAIFSANGQVVAFPKPPSQAETASSE
jgi:hypothetical protein